MDGWVGPAIVAAIISGLVSLIVVQLNFRQSRKIEKLRRNEKTRDFQIALAAEIESDLLNLRVADRSVFLEQVNSVLLLDPSYVPLIPRLAGNPIFEAIVTEIHILPGAVIAPIVRYARLRQTLERFVEDIRDEQFRTMAAERRMLIYSDYTAMFDRLEALATEAKEALDGSLDLNKRGAAPWNR